MKYNIGKATVEFSIESIWERYTDKTAFVSDMLTTHNGIFEEKAFRKILEKVWKEAFPGESKSGKENEEKETVPVTETNEEAPE